MSEILFLGRVRICQIPIVLNQPARLFDSWLLCGIFCSALQLYKVGIRQIRKLRFFTQIVDVNFPGRNDSHLDGYLKRFIHKLVSILNMLH